MSNDASTAAGRSMTDEEYAHNLRRATLASSIGSALEYYDFALYGLAAALIFGKLFFPALGTNAALIASFATLGVGFVARPIGGLVFGSLGDKIGRKWVLMVTIALMGGASTLIGLLPTADQLGSAGWIAPVLLVILRLAQGLGAGAEQAGSTVLMSEYAPRKQRGFFAALPFIGIQAGTLLAAGVFWLVTQAPNDVIEGWLWRVPFLISIVLIAVAVWIRARLKETPTYIELEKHEQVADHPIRELLQTSKRNVLIGIGLRMAENGGSYIYSNLAVSFMVLMGVNKSWGPVAVACASAIGIFTVPLTGWISDRVGRKPVYRAGAIILLLLAFPGWYLLSKGNAGLAVLIIALSIGFGVNSMLGPQCAHLPELFGARHRYIGVAVSREFSAILAGGLGPFIGAWLLATTNNAWWPVATYVAALCVITLISTFITPETVHRDVTRNEDAFPGEDRFAGLETQR
ncbi:MFS transporter [Enemella evansiae]|uniref:MFS transporter n=1 Tax=Enemella evansiae TaxID=2016499 RepID=UPI00105D66E5|nr:MFS transporter [Enemella evansiae]TDO93732.1 MHS family metabolite:H+ symporter-like MFS transporter [Enemella evansiae]